MFPRLSVGSLSAAATVLAVSCSGPVRATPAPAATGTVTYSVANHAQQVTVSDGSGRVLLTRHAATPTLRAVIALQAVATATQRTGLSLTLEDGNGLRLWSTRVSPPRQLKSVSSLQFSAKSSSDVAATRFEFVFSTGAPDAPGADDPPQSASVVCLLGADGHLVSMKSDDSNGKNYDMAVSPNGFSLTGPEGTGLMSLSVADKVSAAMEINGTKVTAVTVRRGGKDYLCFPWNGHNVLVEYGCTFSLNGDGDLIVNAPSASK